MIDDDLLWKPHVFTWLLSVSFIFLLYTPLKMMKSDHYSYVNGCNVHVVGMGMEQHIFISCELLNSLTRNVL